MSEVKKIVWAIDPIESDSDIIERKKEFLTLFCQDQDVEILPVHVLRSEFYLTSEYFEPIDPTPFEEKVKQECLEFLEGFRDLPIGKLTVLENYFSARGAEVRMLTDYVEEENPDFVLLGTHGRGGWARTMLGSFTETFLLQTKVPTVVIGPKVKPLQKLKSALFPVHLGESSQQFVESFLDDHRLAFLEKLTLFHQISMVDIENIAWAPEVYGLKDYSSVDLINKAKETTQKYLESFMDHPLGQKRLDYHISDKVNSIDQSILKFAEQNSYDLVVMKSEANTFEANILGSMTKSVIRESGCPVVVYPHKFKA